MPATTTGAPFSLNIPSASTDAADLFGLYLKPNMTAINTNAAHKGTAQTFSALQTFSAGVTVSSGYVGIGTTSPSVPLEVKGTVTANNGSYNTQLWLARDTNAYSGISFRGAVAYDLGMYSKPSDDSIYIGKWGGSGTWSDMHVFKSSGNVGIGTSSPVAGLHVVSSAVNDVCIESGYPQGVTMQNGAFWEHKKASDTGELSFNYYGYQNGTSYYRDLNIYNGKNALIARFQGSTSRLGIGTGSPSAGLHVSTADGTIIANNTAGTDSAYLLYTTGTLKWSITQAPGAGDRIYIRDAQTNDGVYMAQNTTAWVANSDSRLKDVQGTISNALDKVQQLTGVKFKWKREADNPDAKVRVGLIAQDVQAVLPEAVDDESPDLITDEETGKVSGGLGVRYTEVVPLLVNAIKELTARVVALEAQVASA